MTKEWFHKLLEVGSPIYSWELLLRTGMVAALVPTAGVVAKPFLILTVWLRGSKVKATPLEVPLSAVKCFRAVLLRGSDESENQLEETNHCWLYTAENVFAILDAKVVKGKITISKESIEALENLEQSKTDLPEKHVPQRRRRGGARKKKALKKAGALKAKSKEESAQKKAVVKKKETKPEKSVITSSDIRRSVRGRRNIRQVLGHIWDADFLAFGQNTFFGTDGYCKLGGLNELTSKAFKEKLPLYFEHKYWMQRTPAQYGNKVFGELEKILKMLKNPKPDRSTWETLLRDFHGAMGHESGAIDLEK